MCEVPRLGCGRVAHGLDRFLPGAELLVLVHDPPQQVGVDAVEHGIQRRAVEGAVEGRRLARWRSSAVGLGAHPGGFPAGIFRVDRGRAPFPAAPHQSVHKLLAYTAYRRPSLDGMRGRAVSYVPGQADQAEAVTGHDDVLHAVAAAVAAVSITRRFSAQLLVVRAIEAAWQSCRERAHVPSTPSSGDPRPGWPLQRFGQENAMRTSTSG